MSLIQLKQRMDEWLKKREYQALIFEVDKALIGYVLYRKEKDFIYLRQLFIDRKCRRKGLGKEAMKLLFQKVWPKGSRIVLEVLIHNQRGIEFWKSVGFKPYCLTLEKKT